MWNSPNLGASWTRRYNPHQLMRWSWLLSEQSGTPFKLGKKTRTEATRKCVFFSVYQWMSRDHKVRCVSDMEKSDRLPTISWGLSSVTRRNTYLSLRVMNHCQTKTFGHYSYRFGRGICGKYARACLKIVQRYRRLGTTLISKAFRKREN